MQMKKGFWWMAAWMVVLSNMGGSIGIMFEIDRKECVSHKVEEGATLHFSFVVIKVEGTWEYHPNGVHLLVKGPNGEQIQDFRDKTSGKADLIAHQQGVYQFCFINKSPFSETIDFDVHATHFSFHDHLAKDEHLKPLFEHIGKLEEALFYVQYEQHWIKAETQRQAIVNEQMSRRSIHKALYETTTLICASVLQVYLLRRLFDRKLGMSRV